MARGDLRPFISITFVNVFVAGKARRFQNSDFLLLNGVSYCDEVVCYISYTLITIDTL